MTLWSKIRRYSYGRGGRKSAYHKCDIPVAYFNNLTIKKSMKTFFTTVSQNIYKNIFYIVGGIFAL
jgi:hypothetical protein